MPLWFVLGALLSLTLSSGCGFKRIGSYYFDKKCHRDLPGIWEGESCPRVGEATEGDALDTDEGAGEGGGSNAPQCDLAINPSLCIRDGIEHSVWRTEAKRSTIALSFSLSLQSYYEFKPDGSYTHYLVLTHPFLAKRYYEKRHGAINLETNDGFDSAIWPYTVNFAMDTSSCSSSATLSLFELFDRSNKSHIARSERRLSLSHPDIDFEVEGTGFGSRIALFILDFSELIFEVLFAPLTPGFWQEVITGPLTWDEQTSADLSTVLAASEELCFSEDGFQTVIPKLNIPMEVQLILLSQ